MMDIPKDFESSREYKELLAVQGAADLTIWDEAIKIHDDMRRRQPWIPEFKYFYDWYLYYGFVFKTPSLLLMCHHNADTWFIYLAITRGSLIDLLHTLPYKLDNIEWGITYGKNDVKIIKMKTKRLYRMAGAE